MAIWSAHLTDIVRPAGGSCWQFYYASSMHRKPNRMEWGPVSDWLTAMLRPVSHVDRSPVPIPSPYPLIFTLWYTKIKKLHKTGKLETKKKHVLSLEILEKETPKNEKLGKIVTRKNEPLYSILINHIFMKCLLGNYHLSRKGECPFLLRKIFPMILYWFCFSESRVFWQPKQYSRCSTTYRQRYVIFLRGDSTHPHIMSRE